MVGRQLGSKVAQTHCMIDLETFGNRPNACIQQIGWALFDPSIDDGFYQVLESGNIFVSVDDCLARGLTVNHSCLQWWLGQSEGARKVACKQGAVLPVALGHLNRALGQATRFWCSAPSFDYAILEHAAGTCDVRLAINRKHAMCLRTLRRLTPGVHKGDVSLPIELAQLGEAHVAEYDACKQAVETCHRLKVLTKG